MPTPTPVYLFDTPQNARHSVRVRCDEAGLSLKPSVAVDGILHTPKDVICATLEVESGFYNYKPDGTPQRHVNFEKDGVTVSSTDWGLCQINDYWHIQKYPDFKSVDDVLQHPLKAVDFMIARFKVGKLSDWDAYKNGSFKKHLPQNMYRSN